ncbi:nuclease domain-containing protein [Virgibacillus ndiopensis]|uniref:nuclease domain-containing protein n=1 Tax=Virgibacillus ndiopensis TaxID=2004408 RepID=UPI00318371C2
MSLVLQMAPGYRKAFQIYLTVSKGLVLQGKLYQLSLKDVATLYEYWTFLKLGQILDKNYNLISQDIVQVSRQGLFVNLEANRTAKRIYSHPVTSEKIVLRYQKREGRLPTVTQKPDTMLSIEKKGKEYTFNYIFDAKYRVDYAQDGSYYKNLYQTPGPMEDDINTMHRYRDAIVAENNGPYERTAFGAYVLFPWKNENIYQNHHFYKSIDKVNVGAFPFLPNTTIMVENFIKRLVEMGPEELQEEGILPQGTMEEWGSSLEESVLVGLVSTAEDYKQFIKEKYYTIPVERVKRGWQEAKYIALYVKKGIANENGVLVYGRITDVILNKANDDVLFKIEVWTNLHNPIKPVNYGVANSFMTTLANIKQAAELPELFMKSKEEKIVWKTLRRVSDQINTGLDHIHVDSATQIKEYRLTGMKVHMDRTQSSVHFHANKNIETISFDQLNKNPSRIFHLLVNMLKVNWEDK